MIHKHILTEWIKNYDLTCKPWSNINSSISVFTYSVPWLPEITTLIYIYKLLRKSLKLNIALNTKPIYRSFLRKQNSLNHLIDTDRSSSIGTTITILEELCPDQLHENKKQAAKRVKKKKNPAKGFTLYSWLSDLRNP